LDSVALAAPGSIPRNDPGYDLFRRKRLAPGIR
jgi:hypothetical protein